jgi:hypothetical protein
MLTEIVEGKPSVMPRKLVRRLLGPIIIWWIYAEERGTSCYLR